MMHMHHVSEESPLPNADLPCACTSLRKAARAVSRLYDGHMGLDGANITQFAILRALEREPDQPLSRLAEAMVMDRTSLYRALTPMAREGWIVIQAGSTGRTKIARLAEKGQAVMRQALPHWAAAQTRFIEAFGREEWSALSETLKGVVGMVAGGCRS